MESPNLPVEELTRTEAWGTLQKDVSAYAQGLGLLQRQMTDLQKHQIQLKYSMIRESYWFSGLGLITSTGMLVFAMMNRQTDGAEGIPLSRQRNAILARLRRMSP